MYLLLFISVDVLELWGFRTGEVELLSALTCSSVPLGILGIFVISRGLVVRCYCPSSPAVVFTVASEADYGLDRFAAGVRETFVQVNLSAIAHKHIPTM
jgi:hypothetical protein